MSNADDALVETSGDLAVENTAKISDTGNLKNDYPIVLVDRADVAEVRYHLAGGPWCLDDPEREERATPIRRGL